MIRVGYPNESGEMPIQRAKFADEFLRPDDEMASTSQGRRRDPGHEPLAHRPCGPFAGHAWQCPIPRFA
jgi:hypothetical protein